MTLTWAQRREELLDDCIVSPDVFNPMIDRLAAFVVPYQQALKTEAAQRNMHLYLHGLLSHLPSKNAEDIATFGQCRTTGRVQLYLTSHIPRLLT